MADKCTGPLAARPEALPPARGVVDIRRLLAWAIGYQKAHVAARSASLGVEAMLDGGSRSMTAIVAEVGLLGCEIDRPSAGAMRGFSVDDDAALVFDQVTACLRSYPIYNLVMAHAETDTEPDWKPNARFRAEPGERADDGRARQSSHNVEYAVPVWAWRVRNRRTKREEVQEQLGGLRPPGAKIARWLREIVRGVPFTPIAWHDTPEEIVAARGAYRVWHTALGQIAGALNVDAGRPGGLERWHAVTHPAVVRYEHRKVLVHPGRDEWRPVRRHAW